MSNSTTNIDQIASNQAAKEVVVNALFDAASPAMLWGRRASTSAALTWGYFGGSYVDSTGTLHAIANGSVTLTASTTNYVYADPTTGAITVNTTGFPAGKVPLYSIVTGTTTVTSYTDCRSYAPSAVGSGGTSALATLTDVTLASLADQNLLVYSSTATKWKNLALSLSPLGADYLNPSDTSSKIALSGGNLTATLGTVPASYCLTRGTVSHASGKWYFEFTCPATLTTLQGGGVATSSNTVDTANATGQSDSTGSFLRSDGFATGSGTTAASVTQVASSKVMVAVDIDNGKIWYRIANGNWNNSGTANPSTNVGGISITAGLTYFPFLNFSFGSTTGANSAMSLNLGGSAFTNTPPATLFSAWNANDNTGVQPSDVSAGAPNDGQSLSYSSSAGKWVAGNTPYDMLAYIPGVPANSAIMGRFVIPRAVTLPVSLTGSYASAEVAATATTTLTITRNGSSIGSISFAAGATTGTFTFSSAVTTAAGDILRIVNQATADATLAGVSVTLVGKR